jgi:hypothetical protein
MARSSLACRHGRCTQPRALDAERPSSAQCMLTAPFPSTSRCAGLGLLLQHTVEARYRSAFRSASYRVLSSNGHALLALAQIAGHETPVAGKSSKADCGFESINSWHSTAAYSGDEREGNEARIGPMASAALSAEEDGLLFANNGWPDESSGDDLSRTAPRRLMAPQLGDEAGESTKPVAGVLGVSAVTAPPARLGERVLRPGSAAGDYVAFGGLSGSAGGPTKASPLASVVLRAAALARAPEAPSSTLQACSWREDEAEL